MLPEKVMPTLQEHLERVRRLHQEDLAAGGGSVYLPGALERKYPHAAREWRWQYVFPARDLSTDPRSGTVRRHHLDESTLHRAISLQLPIQARPPSSPAVLSAPVRRRSGLAPGHRSW